MGIPRSDEFTSNPYDYRWGSDNSVETRTVTLAAGQVLKKGSVLGRIDATGEYVLCAKTKADASAVNDGSQRARLVLASSVDTTGGSKKGVTYTKGTFPKTRVSVGTGHTLLTAEEDLRDLGIYLSEVAIPAVG